MKINGKDNFAPDRANARNTCCRCGARTRANILFAAPIGWKRIADSLGRAVYICNRCKR